jgi:Uma2 family endonuclease
MIALGGLPMNVAARRIDHEVWSQSRYLAWLETQPETSHFEFDGARPVAMAPATVGHNRVGRNIRDAIGQRLSKGTPCDVYGPQDAIETVGGALREPDAFIACSQPSRTGVVVPAPVVVFEVLSPGRENRRRDEQDKVDEYESVPTILRYVVVESERRGYQVFWRVPGDREWQRGAPEQDGPISVPEFGIELALDEVYAAIAFD